MGKPAETHGIKSPQASTRSQNVPKRSVGTKHRNGKSHAAR